MIFYPSGSCCYDKDSNSKTLVKSRCCRREGRGEIGMSLQLSPRICIDLEGGPSRSRSLGVQTPTTPYVPAVTNSCRQLTIAFRRPLCKCLHLNDVAVRISMISFRQSITTLAADCIYHPDRTYFCFRIRSASRQLFTVLRLHDSSSMKN